jgi:hypothetical protein
LYLLRSKLIKPAATTFDSQDFFHGIHNTYQIFKLIDEKSEKKNRACASLGGFENIKITADASIQTAGLYRLI